MSGAERDGILRNLRFRHTRRRNAFHPRLVGGVVCACGEGGAPKRARSRGAISPSSKGVDEALATPSDRGSQ